MSSVDPRPKPPPGPVIDGLATALFAAFVGFLLLGYLDPDFPYSGLATLPLVGSLAALFWANLRSDRIVRPVPPSPIS